MKGLNGCPNNVISLTMVLSYLENVANGKCQEETGRVGVGKKTNKQTKNNEVLLLSFSFQPVVLELVAYSQGKGAPSLPHTYT